MSAINTNGIDVNFPVPGVNNSSQGFRTNFAAVKNNLNTAATEISDLQSKAVLKSALSGLVIDNDMDGTLLSNVQTRSFRASTYNLGSDLTGSVVIDVSMGDVQIGAITGDVLLQFTGWTPIGQNNVKLELAVSNANAVVSFPSSISSTDCLGASTLENYDNDTNSVSIPAGVCQLNYRLSTDDCGNTVLIEPYNRPRRSTQIRQRTPAPTGLPGDMAGAVAVSPAISQLVISNTTTSSNVFTTTDTTTQLFEGQSIIFTGVTFGGPAAGTTYYVRDIVDSTTFTVTSSVGGANLALSTAAGTMYANPASYLYLCTDTYSSTPVSLTVSEINSNTITHTSSTALVLNAPIVFTTGPDYLGEIVSGTVYYIKSMPLNTELTISRGRTAGVADGLFVLSDSDVANTAGSSCVSYNGPDIWKRTALTPW